MPVGEYAASLGLAVAPRMRFLAKAGKKAEAGEGEASFFPREFYIAFTASFFPRPSLSEKRGNTRGQRPFRDAAGGGP